MSVNRNRKKLNKAHNGRTYRIMWLKIEYPRYWDEGVNFYPRYRKGFKNPNKQLYTFQMRMYKTWKHNRKKQWKSK